MINVALLTTLIRQKLKTEHLVKSTVQKQSNKHQNLQKTLIKADKKKISCMPETAASPNFRAHQLRLAETKLKNITVIKFPGKKKKKTSPRTDLIFADKILSHNNLYPTKYATVI